MKEKINLLSKGIFDYARPGIVVSEEKIKDQGTSAMPIEGTFTIKSSNYQEIRAMIFSSDKRVTVDSAVAGKNCTVHYRCDTRNTAEGQKITGHFSLLSNGGDLEIPFEFSIYSLYCNTSIGRINTLSQFTDLAKANRTEALTIFCEPLFPRVFIKNKKSLHNYEMLIHCPDMSRAMEEFLCYTKRKKPVRFKVSTDPVIYGDVREKTGGKILIEKNDWGYEILNVSSEGSFIRLFKKRITTDEFLGSFYELTYEIDPEGFSGENNEGAIIIESNLEQFRVPLRCTRISPGPGGRKDSRKLYFHSMASSYLRYKCGKTDSARWQMETGNALSGLEIQDPDDISTILMRIHFMMLTSETEEAVSMLKKLNGREIRRTSMTLYCYYLYLTAIYKNEENYTKFVVERIESYYGSGTENWRILCMLLDLNDHITDERKLMLLRNAYERGSFSPFIYLSALEIYRRDPSLMRQTDLFDLQVINFSVKYNALDTGTAGRFASLYAGTRGFSELALSVLRRIYNMTSDRDILSTICSLYIRGNITSDISCSYFREAIIKGIKLTNLYESYMYSLDPEQREEIPREVLLYFMYDNRLPRNKKAMLYAYVTERKDREPALYSSYETIIRSFTYEMLHSGYINEDMAVLYRNFITEDDITETTAPLLPDILFKHEVICRNPHIKGVIVSHNDIETEDHYPLVRGKAFVDIFMDDNTIMAVDSESNRYAGTIPVKVKPLFEDSALIKKCAAVTQKDARLLLNRSEKALKYQRTDDQSILMYKKLLDIKNISKDYQKSILKNLVDYYYENYEGLTLEKYLLQLNIDLFDPRERKDIVEYYIQKGIYENAYEACCRYGYEDIDKKRLMRLCSRVIRDSNNEYDAYLLEMAYNVFEAGRYDETILLYLAEYYMGMTVDMYRIWKACGDFELSAPGLEERLLCNILFTEMHVDKGMEIFASYSKKKTDSRIVRAFLSYYSWLYLIKDKSVSPALFEYIEMELDHMKECRDVCGLALLKHYSKERRAGVPDWIQKEAAYFTARGLVLPFFGKFSDDITVPAELVSGSFIEYRTDPGSTATVKYFITDEDSEAEKTFTTAELENVFSGICLKRINVFRGEELKYFVTESGDNDNSITDQGVIKGPDHDAPEIRDAIDRINELIGLSAAGDPAGLQDKAVEFERLSQVSKKLFHLSEQEGQK